MERAEGVKKIYSMISTTHEFLELVIARTPHLTRGTWQFLEKLLPPDQVRER